jgi:hypothetical protein
MKKKKIEDIIDDDEEMPELEDCTEELQKIRINTYINEDTIDSEIKVNVINTESKKKISIPIKETKENSNIIDLKNENQIIVKEKTLKDEGFKPKRGFFHRIAEKEKNENITKEDNLSKKEDKVADLTNIKATGETSKEKLLSDFKSQVNMNTNDLNKSMNYLNNKKDEWCNSDLLTAMASKPSLMKLFSNPKFPEAIAMMQKDPKKFMEIYGKNPEFTEFIKEFSGTMANHFDKLGKEKEKENSIPIDKESEKILNEPKVKSMIERIQREGKLDYYEIQKDPDLFQKIKILIDKGIFKLQNY